MFDLTLQERKAILVVLAFLLLGLAARVFIKSSSNPPPLNYIPESEIIIKININSADKEELMSVPGIGEKISQRIIEYRNKNRYFNDVEELRNITGITSNRYDKIKEYIIVK